MRFPVFSAATLTVVTVGALTLGVDGTTAQASGGTCLKFRDLQGMTRIDDKTFLASTRLSKQKYVVTMRHACREFGRIDNYYTVRLHSTWECLDGDDVFVFRYGGACFVDNVQPVPTKVPG